MAECAKGDGRIADISGIGEHHLQDGNIFDDWRRDGCDKQKDGGGEEEEGTNMVDDSCRVSHFDGIRG